MTKPFAVLAVLVTLFTLLRVCPRRLRSVLDQGSVQIEFMSIYTPKWERWFLLMVFVTGAIVSYALLSVADPSWFCFDLEQATVDLNEQLHRIAREIQTQVPVDNSPASLTSKERPLNDGLITSPVRCRQRCSIGGASPQGHSLRRGWHYHLCRSESGRPLCQVSTNERV